MILNQITSLNRYQLNRFLIQLKSIKQDTAQCLQTQSRITKSVRPKRFNQSNVKSNLIDCIIQSITNVLNSKQEAGRDVTQIVEMLGHRSFLLFF